MPDPSSTSSLRNPSADVAPGLRTSCAVVLAVVLGYGLLTLPILARNGFDPSVFIHAGDRFVDPARLELPIIVKLHADGYDGQFYYRMALAPLRMQQAALGIRFDSPRWRVQRIVYPLLAWVAAFGHAAAVPATMVLVNLLGLGAIATVALRLTARLRLPTLTPLAIMLWPGFVIALTHDTTEIVATAFLLGALDCYFAKRLLAYAGLGVLASLTRETSILLLGGILCFEAAQAVRPAAAGQRWHRVLICGLALVPFLVWWDALRLIWDQSPQETIAHGDVGWPFAGAAEMLRDTLTGVRRFAPGPGMNAAIGAYLLGSAAWLLGFCAIVAARTPVVLRVAGTGALAAGWLPIVALMSLLTADGPWIDQTAFFRAFTECYVVGCLVLAVRPVPRWLTWLILAGGALAFLGAWVLTVGEK